MLITGIAGEIGRFIAEAFLDEGWCIFGLDLKPDQGFANRPGVFYQQCDLSIAAAAAEAIDRFCAEHGPFDVVINCAGIIANSPLLSFSGGRLACHDPKLWDSVIVSSLSSAFYTTAYSVRHMVGAARKGVVINISSICANGNPGQVAYSAAKAGLNGMTKALAKELGPLGIRVVGLAPGYFDTSSTRANVTPARLKDVQNAVPLKRLGKLEEIVTAIRFILTNEYLNGAIIPLDGGMVL